ncbi:hypothetical protein HJG60_008670 [Phyllostomus discolor]|uniref:Uncharacterized protein n=1 Tax=Phyllostomus discolor TaxID=89673 RepID=A0A833YT51_9CHIR|nr:hypothetical protein HJG60_008670 [Phyllostomus discolor]
MRIFDVMQFASSTFRCHRCARSPGLWADGAAELILDTSPKHNSSNSKTTLSHHQTSKARAHREGRQGHPAGKGPQPSVCEACRHLSCVTVSVREAALRAHGGACREGRDGRAGSVCVYVCAGVCV